MSFASPWAWLWLLSLVPVLILHFLRRREREYPVSALFLWEGIRPDRPHFLERLRRRFDLLLLLQVFAVLLFSLALSQPFLPSEKPSGATLLVLDGSASVLREGVAEGIVSQAREVISRSAGPWAILLWADPPEILCGRTFSAAEALQSLSRFRPRLGRRPELAQALALFPEPWPRIVVITDNPAGISGVEVVQVPRPENLAITAFSVRPSPDGTRYEAFLRILNDTHAYKDVQVRVRTSSGEYWASRLVPPQEEEIVILLHFRWAGKRFCGRAQPHGFLPLGQRPVFRVFRRGSAGPVAGRGGPLPLGRPAGRGARRPRPVLSGSGRSFLHGAQGKPARSFLACGSGDRGVSQGKAPGGGPHPRRGAPRFASPFHFPTPRG